MSVQIDRLHLRGGAGAGLASVVAAERALEARAIALGRPLLNLTYADTKRFPHRRGRSRRSPARPAVAAPLTRRTAATPRFAGTSRAR